LDVSAERVSALPWRLGSYELGAKIADGGMASVYVGRRSTDRQLVAIKRIRDDYANSREFVAMFLDEARILARMHHPGIVRTLEIERDGAGVFIAMELLRGHSLWTLWDACRVRGERLSFPMIAWIGARVAESLHYAHELVDERGVPLEVVHRDVNATNIFVTYDGAIKVIDFGLARSANRSSKTAAGIIKGKVAYMSPEQAIGAPIDRRTDLFALGITLWELACDRRLFKHADEVETLKRVHAAEVPDPTTLVRRFPLPLARAIMRALERDVDRRYPTGAELARDLDAFALGYAGQVEIAAMIQDLFPDDDHLGAPSCSGGAEVLPLSTEARQRSPRASEVLPSVSAASRLTFAWDTRLAYAALVAILVVYAFATIRAIP
jgi:serine/threonine-protein kinase